MNDVKSQAAEELRNIAFRARCTAFAATACAIILFGASGYALWRYIAFKAAVVSVQAEKATWRRASWALPVAW